MGFLSDLIRKFKGNAGSKAGSASGGNMCSVEEALGELKSNVQAKKVVDLCIDLFGKTEITTGSGAKVKISDLKNRLNRLSLDEFTALNVTMAKLAEELKNPSEEYRAAADPDLLKRIAPVAEEVSEKFADYFFEKRFS